MDMKKKHILGEGHKIHIKKLPTILNRSSYILPGKPHTLHSGTSEVAQYRKKMGYILVDICMAFLYLAFIVDIYKV